MDAADPGLCVSTANKVQGRPDERVARRAAGDWGVLSLDELRECGLDRGAVRSRVRIGWLHPLYRGIYAVGHAGVPAKGRFLAAVKSLGPDAVLSHFSAAAHWGFVDWDGRHPEVTVPREGIGRRHGIRVHCTSTLGRRDVMRHEGIPLTSPGRTLVDLAGAVTYALLRRAVRRAQSQRRVSVPLLVAAIYRLGPRRGTASLKRILATGPAPTRSELEDVVYDLIVDGGLARPDVNRPLLLAGRRVIPDFRWPKQRVVVEADGAAWHDDPVSRGDDAERQALMEADGDRVLRVTWSQAITRPAETLARIRAAGAPEGAERPGRTRWA